MSTTNPPISFGQTQSDLGHAFLFAAQEILLELQDRLSVFGLLPLVGDVAGSGTDTLRITHMGNVGWSVRMDALAVENAAITPKQITHGYATITTAQYGLAHSETYRQQNLGRVQGVRLDRLKAQVPASFMATMRYLVCVVGSGFSGVTVGDTALPLSIDDLLDLATIYREALGVAVRGMPITMLSPQQLTQVLESAESHPAYQGSRADFTADQGLDFRQEIDNLLGLGFRALITDDVQQSGGAYRGFSFQPGGIGWARANSNNIIPANPQGAEYIPEFGMLIEELPDGARTAERTYNARAEFGVAAGDNTIHKQVGILSAV